MIDNYYTTIFYDIHNGNTVTAVLLIENKIEESLNFFYGEASEELIQTYERQFFDLANAVRGKRQIHPTLTRNQLHEIIFSKEVII